MFDHTPELEPPGPTPEPGGSSQPDPVADLIELDAFYNALVKVLIILAAAVALIFVVGP